VPKGGSPRLLLPHDLEQQSKNAADPKAVRQARERYSAPVGPGRETELFNQYKVQRDAFWATQSRLANFANSRQHGGHRAVLRRRPRSALQPWRSDRAS
jgi:hypothetical protein